MSYQDYRQSLNRQLSDKVQQELSSFREEMLSKSPQEIYEAAYQIATKNDIAECFSGTNYSPNTVKALMKSSNLLNEIYEEWLAADCSHMDDLQQTVSDFKDYGFVEAVVALTGVPTEWIPPPQTPKKDEPKVLLLPPKNKDCNTIWRPRYRHGNFFCKVCGDQTDFIHLHCLNKQINMSMFTIIKSTLRQYSTSP